MRNNRDDYKYLRLADALTALNQRVNLMGIIVEHGTPSRSKGTDWFCSLRIVDESYNKVRGLLVNIFAQDQSKLPQIEATGDILLLSQVVMKTHNQETYALFNKKYSSFALYEGKYSQRCNPYQVSSKFSQRNEDIMFVVNLRKWAQSCQLDTVSKDCLMLRQLKEGQCLALVCKILHISQISQYEWMLFVWDGSDAPPLQLQSELNAEMDTPLPLQWEYQPLARDTLCRFPTVGTILRVSIDQRNVKLNVLSLTAGRWVKFINLMVEVHDGLWCAVLTPSTKVRFIPNEDAVIIERQRDYEERFTSKINRMPFTSFPFPYRITEIDDVDSVPFVTLMDIMTYSQAANIIHSVGDEPSVHCESQVTAKFKCIVRVVAALPWAVQDFRSPDGTYRVRLTLEDPTARIHAYLYADDGEKFFEGSPTMDDLIPKWNTLLGVSHVDNGGIVENAPRDPPWVQCCIKSYYLNKDDVWGSRQYRIFNTTLVC